MLEVMIGTGVKAGDLLGLCVNNVGIGERSGIHTIRQTKYSGYHEIPSTHNGSRALGPNLKTHPETGNPDTPVWFGQSDSLSDPSSVTRILNKYTILAGLDRINPHALRHTFATRHLKANKGDLRELAKLLGQVSFNTAMIYTESDMEDLAERMECVKTGS